MLVTAVGTSTAADPLEVFAGQNKNASLDVEVVFNDAKLVRPDPPDPSKSYTFAWDFDASRDLDQDGISDNDNETTTLLTAHTFTAPGVYTATLWVRDSAGGVAKDTLQVTVVDDRVPVARIVSIHPTEPYEDDTVSFRGEGTVPGGIIEEFEWRSNLDGRLSNTTAFNTSLLSVGVHAISLRVRDERGLWSEPATATVAVRPNLPFTLVVLTDTTRVDVGTTVRLRVSYLDPEGDAPVLARVGFGRDEPYRIEPLLEADPADADLRDGKEYYLNATLEKPGDYVYYFVFENERNPQQTSSVGHIEVVRVRGRVPGPDAVATVVAMVVAVVVSVGWARRRTGP
jgi:PKD repeat protein